MKKSYKYIFALIASFTSFATLTYAGAASLPNSVFTNINVERNQDVLSVCFDVNPADIRLPYNKMLEVVPVIKSEISGDSILLPVVTIAGKNAYYNALRQGDVQSLLRGGSAEKFAYSCRTDVQQWMQASTLSFNIIQRGCCRTVDSDNDIAVAEMDWRIKRFEPQFNYLVPKADTVKARRLEGRAYVSFPVNKIEIYPDYMINPAELKKITGSIDTVRLNPDASVKAITLTGYASPEGPYKNNVRLAQGRTEAVKEYVRRQFTFPRAVFHTHYVPEDWAGLRDSVAAGNLADRTEILNFIDNGNVVIERRNDELKKRFPKSYAMLLKNVYPWLRHTDYAIDYELRVYTDLSEILEVLKSRPENLSLNEFFVAANSYPRGSREANEIWDKAVVYFPDSEVAALNAANAAITQHDYHRARMLLSRIKEPGIDNADAQESVYPDAVYALGIISAMENDFPAAADYFNKALKLGVKEAAPASQQIKELQSHQPIKIVFNN